MHTMDRPVRMASHLATIARALVVLCCAVGLLLPVMGKEAHACDCEPPRPEDKERSDAVFVARTTEVHDPQHGQVGAMTEVTEVYAGQVDEELFVETPNDTCAYEFEVGREDLIYAIETDGRFSTHMCSALPLADAGDHIAALGEANAPLPISESPEGGADRTARNVTLGFLGVIVLIVVGRLFTRQGRAE